MRLLILNIKENSELLSELRRHFITDSFNVFIEKLLNDIICEFDLDDNLVFTSGILGDLSRTFISVIDKILLDNIFKYIVYKNIDNFIYLLNNRTLHMDMRINHFYTLQLIEIVEKYINFSDDEKYSLEFMINYKLQEIINEIYVNNTSFLTPVILKLFDSMYDCVGHMNFNSYKFELDMYNRPMIFFIEKENNASFCHQ